MRVENSDIQYIIHSTEDNLDMDLDLISYRSGTKQDVLHPVISKSKVSSHDLRSCKNKSII